MKNEEKMDEELKLFKDVPQEPLCSCFASCNYLTYSLFEETYGLELHLSKYPLYLRVFLVFVFAIIFFLLLYFLGLL